MSARAPASTGTVQSTDCGDRVLALEGAIEAALANLRHYDLQPEDFPYMRDVSAAERILSAAMRGSSK